MDLYSTKDYVLRPMEQQIIKTGLQMELPENYFGSIEDKSGLAGAKSAGDIQ